LRKYDTLAAAGDRHLVEFVDNSWYLKDRETVKKWHFGLTTVDWRIANQDRLIRESVEMAEGRREVPLAPSGEALVDMLRGIMGLKTVITNVNLPNSGQMPGLPEGSIVETNCIFTNGFVDPIVSKPLPAGALALVRRNSDNIDLLSEGIAERNEKKIFTAFINQPLCAGLGFDEAIQLFKRMRISEKTI
ncbi:MAG: alpha-glucosidase/alpha-galactosidase, partial [Lachnospiraceae bacterium]|nr:alpha-glucosidase/alpha-galactosidase [Lachnospiraceae bacterium]